jgi:hypothetical protein
MHEIKLGGKTKNPHGQKNKHQHCHVDNVDNLFSKNAFSDFDYISGSHSYQQVIVYTFF